MTLPAGVRPGGAAAALRRVRRFVAEHGGVANTLRIAWRKARRCGPVEALAAVCSHAAPVPRWPRLRYRRFRKLHETPFDASRAADDAAALHAPPRIAVLVTPGAPGAVAESLASLRAQAFPAATVVATEGEATAAALDRACAALPPVDFVAVVRAGDRLAPEALLRTAQAAEAAPEADVVHTDEDALDRHGRRHSPLFKPQWSPDTLLAWPYLGDLSLYRRAMLQAAGGFAVGAPGTGDAWGWDTALRVTERARRVVRVPGVLYHRRADFVPLRAACTLPARHGWPGAAAAARVLEAAVRRRGLAARVETGGEWPRVVYDVQGEPLVSVIVPTRNHGSDVETCLSSLDRLSAYRRYEVLLVDNGSDEADSLAVFARWRDAHGVRVLRRDEPFNFSRLNNAAVRAARGEYLLFLNNDTEWLEAGALSCLLGFAQQPGIGAVGARLLYPDGTLQHAGVARVGEGPTHVFGHLPEHYPHPRCRLDGNWSAVTAACLMVSRAAFDAVGGFDEGLAVAYNDVDLCFRLLAAGRRNVLAAGARLRHAEFRTRGNDRAEASKHAGLLGELQRLYARWPQYRDDPGYNPNLSRDLPNFMPWN